MCVCMCVCVIVCVFGQHLFFEICLVKLYRRLLSVYFFNRLRHLIDLILSGRNWPINLPELIGSQVLLDPSRAIIKLFCPFQMLYRFFKIHNPYDGPKWIRKYLGTN